MLLSSAQRKSTIELGPLNVVAISQPAGTVASTLPSTLATPSKSSKKLPPSFGTLAVRNSGCPAGRTADEDKANSSVEKEPVSAIQRPALHEPAAHGVSLSQWLTAIALSRSARLVRLQPAAENAASKSA